MLQLLWAPKGLSHSSRSAWRVVTDGTLVYPIKRDALVIFIHGIDVSDEMSSARNSGQQGGKQEPANRHQVRNHRRYACNCRN